MRLIALVLFALLAFSFIPFLVEQQASALSAITFTALTPTAATRTLNITEPGGGDVRFNDAATTNLLAYISPTSTNDGLMTDLRNYESTANVLGSGAVAYPNLFPWTDTGFYIDGTWSYEIIDSSGTEVIYEQTGVNANYTVVTTMTTSIIEGRTFIHVETDMTVTNDIALTRSVNVEVDSREQFNYVDVYQNVSSGDPTITTINLSVHNGTHFFYDTNAGDSLVLYNTDGGSAAVAIRYLGHSINGTDFTSMTNGSVVWNTDMIVDTVDNIEFHPIEQSSESGGTPATIEAGTTISLEYDIIVSRDDEKDLSSWVLFVDEGASPESLGVQFENVYEPNGTVYMSDGTDEDEYYHHTVYDIANADLKNYTYDIFAGGDKAEALGYVSPVETRDYSLDFAAVSSETVQVVDNSAYSPLDLETEMTIMFWMEADSTAGSPRLVRKEGAYTVAMSGGGVRCTYWSGGSQQSFAFTSATISTGVWVHIACTYDGTTVKMYRDGVSQQNAADTGTIDQNNNDLYFASEQGAGNFFDGRLKDVRVYNVAKTQAQVQSVYNGNNDMGGIVGMWDFPEGGGTVTDDMSTNDLDGTLINTPTYSSDVPANGFVRTVLNTIGRDTTTGKIVYGIADANLGRQIADGQAQSSDLAPLDIAQSTGSLYSTAIGATDYGTLYDVSLERDFDSYTETSILAGTVGTAAFGILYDETTSTNDQNINAVDGIAVAELINAGSDLIGQPLNVIVVSLSKDNAPTGDLEVGTLDSSGNIDFLCATMDSAALTTSQATYAFICPDYTIAQGDRIGVRYDGGDATNTVEVFYRGAGGVLPNSALQRYTGSWAALGGADADITGKFAFAHAKTVVYDDSTPIRYHIFESGTNNIEVIKRTGSTTTISATIDHTTGEPFSVVQLTDRIIIQTATDTYQLLTSTDAISTLHSNSFPTRYPQTFEISPASRTFNTDQIMIANATYAILYNPNTAASERTGVLIETVNTGGSGSIEGYDPAKWYFLPENDLTAEASATTWTIKDVGSREEVELTAYTEELGIDLVENTTAILGEDVIHLVCDNGDYLIEVQYFAVGSDADCNNWKTLDISSASTGRMLPYSTSGELVHASEYTEYTVQISVASPTVYEMTTIYDAFDVDTGEFDSGGNTLQYLLFGNCYTLEIVEESTGNTLQTGLICAGNIDPITISLTGIVIPDDWLRSTWSYNIQRNYTSDAVLFTFQKSVAPYNGSLYVTDNFDPAEATFEQWYNFTEVSGASIANVTGTSSNMTLYFTLYENGSPVITAVSNAEFEVDNPFSTENFGLLFGVPAAFIFPILTAAMFPRSLAYFGSIVTVAVIGLLSIFGYITLPLWFWAIIMPVLAFAIFVGHKRS